MNPRPPTLLGPLVTRREARIIELESELRHSRKRYERIIAAMLLLMFLVAMSACGFLYKHDAKAACPQSEGNCEALVVKCKMPDGSCFVSDRRADTVEVCK